MFQCVGAGCRTLPDIALEPFFKHVETASKNVASKRGNINLANKCIADALVDMDRWIGKGNWKNGFGKMFIDLKDLLAKYEVRLSGQSVRQAEVHHSMTPARSSENALHVYIKEPRRADKIIPSISRHLKARLEETA